LATRLQQKAYNSSPKTPFDRKTLTATHTKSVGRMARNSTLYNSNFSTTVNLPFGLCSTVGSASVSYTISSRRIPSSISVQGESPVQNPIIFPNHHGWIVYSLSNPEVLSSILNGGSFLFCLHSKNTERRLTVSATPRRSFTSIRALWRRRRARKEAACEAVEKNQISMEKNQVFYLLYGEQSDLRPFFLPLSFWSPRGSAATSQFRGAPLWSWLEADQGSL
jgi:hypothetical protein